MRYTFLVVAAFIGLFAFGQEADPPGRAYDWRSGRSLAHYVILPNDTANPTVQRQLVSTTTVGNVAYARNAPVGTPGSIGVCVANCGNSGKAVILITGQVRCAFDGPVVARHFVSISMTQDGKCKDAGSTRPSFGKIVGLSTEDGTTEAEVVLFGVGTHGSLHGIYATTTLDFPSRGGGICDDLTIPVPNAAIGEPVILALPSVTAARSIFNAWVSAANVVSVRHCSINNTNDPPSASYTVVVLKQLVIP